MWGISELIGAIDNAIHAEERAIEAGKEAAAEIGNINKGYKSQADTVDEAGEAYAKLAQGVDQLTGKNKSLSTDDYKEFLNLSNSLADVFPHLVKGYDENGNAILRLNGDAETITDTLISLDTSDMSLEEIIGVWDNFIAKVKETLNLLDDSPLIDILVGFTFDERDLNDRFEATKKELADKFAAGKDDVAKLDKFLNSITSTEDMELLLGVAMKGEYSSFSELVSAYNSVKKGMESGISINIVTENFNKVKGVIFSVSGALGEFGASGGITLETFQGLIAVSDEYADCLKYNSGRIEPKKLFDQKRGKISGNVV